MSLGAAVLEHVSDHRRPGARGAARSAAADLLLEHAHQVDDAPVHDVPARLSGPGPQRRAQVDVVVELVGGLGSSVVTVVDLIDLIVLVLVDGGIITCTQRW